jgi:hypothetical protein
MQEDYQRPVNVTPARVYPDNVVLEWCPMRGPASSWGSEVHPSQQRTKAAATAIAITPDVLRLMRLHPLRAF